jgi:hypothetical protein
MEYVHNNMQSKTISTLGYEFCISTNTNLGGKKTYKALEDEDRLDPHLSSPFPHT